MKEQFKNLFFVVLILVGCSKNEQNPIIIPSSLTAKTYESNVILSWSNKLNSSTVYTVYRKQDLNDWRAVATIDPSANSWTDQDAPNVDTLRTIITFSYKIATSGESTYSNDASVSLYPLPPAAPSNITIKLLSGSELQINWKDNSVNETGFRIFKADAYGNKIQLATVKANVSSWIESNFNQSEQFTYFVEAYNERWASSGSLKFTIPYLIHSTSILGKWFCVMENTVGDQSFDGKESNWVLYNGTHLFQFNSDTTFWDSSSNISQSVSGKYVVEYDSTGLRLNYTGGNANFLLMGVQNDTLYLGANYTFAYVRWK